MASIFTPNEDVNKFITPAPTPPVVAPTDTTPNLGLNKPLVGGDSNAWGDMLNENSDKLDVAIPAKADKTYVDTQLATKAGLSGGNSFAGDQSIAGNLAVSASFTLTQDGTGWVLRPNVAGQKLLAVGVAGGGSLDKFDIWATEAQVHGLLRGVTAADETNDTLMATTAFVQRAKGLANPRWINEANYNFKLEDMGCTLRLSAAIGTAYLPAAGTVAWPWGARIDIVNRTSNDTWINAGTGNILGVKEGYWPMLRGDMKGASLILEDAATHSWMLIGDLCPK